MRHDQLERARQVRWRQDGNALLTLDDAERWLADTPLCLYLPRRVHMPVPAPSFVEAIAGKADATPGPENLAAAADMLARLVASGAVVALNLFGAVSGLSGEQPDFLATPEALPYLFALQPERNAKRGPSTTGSSRVSPLAVEVWKTLERDGALTTDELRQRLGREVTEAAVLRAIGELWHAMRVVLVPAEGGGSAHWELLQSRHRRELTMGSTQSQTTALSILASFYLQSAVAATGEDAEIFLSPVASRSRIRDVVHGLSATRQLASFPLDGDQQLYVEGSLPEIPEDEAVPVAEDAGLEDNEPSFAEAAGIPEPAATERPMTEMSPKRAYPPRPTERPAFRDRARTGFAARDRRAPAGDRPPRREGSFHKPAAGGFRRRDESGADRSRSSRSTAPRPDRPRSERPPRTNRFTSSGAERRPAVGFRGPRPDARPTSRPAGAAPRVPGGLEEVRRPTFDRGSARSGSAGRPPFQRAGARPQSGFKKPGFRKPADGAGRPPRSGGFSGSGRPPGDRPFRKREGDTDRPRSFARPSGEGRPPRRDSAPDAAGDRPFKKPYTPRPRPSGTDRPRSDRPSQGRSGADRPFKKPYAAKKTYASRSDRPSGGRPFNDRPRGPRPAAAGSEGAPRRSFTPRTESGERREGAARRPYATRPGGASRERTERSGGFSKPGGFGKGKPGGFKKPVSFGKGPSRPGGFSKPGGAPKRFGAPRPNAASDRPPGTDRPPAKGRFSGGFKRSSAPRPGGRRPGGSRPPGKRPGGFAPPTRKPRRDGDEG